MNPTTLPQGTAQVIETQAVAPAVAAAEELKIFGQIESTQDLATAILESGLDYSVESIVTCPKGEPDVDIEGFRAIRRTDTKKVFNIPTDAYEIAQNQEVLDFAHPLIIEAKGLYTRMGFFKSGASIFAFAQLPEGLIVNDKLQLRQNIVIQSSHDGSASVTIRFLTTGHDAITENLVMPYNDEIGRVSYRHTRNVKLRMDEVAALLARKNKYFQKLKTDTEALRSSPMSDEQAQDFINTLLEINPDPTAKISSRKLEARDGILRMFREMHRFDLQNTKYGMILAVAQHRSVEAGTRKVGADMTEAEARFASVFSGASCQDIEWSWSRLLKLQSQEAA